MPKPLQILEWMLNNNDVGAVVFPDAGLQDSGYSADESPEHQPFNGALKNISQWLAYLDEISDVISNLSTVYAAIVGTGDLATHADLNEVMADGDIPQGSRILVITGATIDTIQQITKHNTRIDFQPGVIYLKGTATSAIQVSANGVKISDGILQGFSGGGDAAILIDVASNNTKVRDTHFKTCSNDGVTDNGVNTTVLGATEEA